MRVINISHEDYANFSYDNCQAMRSVGINADAFILKRHPFNYSNQATQLPINKIREECLRADIIQVMHTCGTMYDVVKDLGKPVIVWHTGTRYRQGYEKHNERWNPLAVKHVCVLPELMKLGCINPEFISMTVDVNKLQPDYSVPEILRIAHYPSNVIVKGTKAITQMMAKVRQETIRPFHFNCMTNKVSFSEQLRRLLTCDIYVELFAPTQDGYEYGSFGTTALEAAALGKIVVTNNINSEIYLKHYGQCELMIANTPTQFDLIIKGLLNFTHEKILEKKKSTRLWVEKNHSQKATGTRIQAVLNSVVTPL